MIVSFADAVLEGFYYEGPGRKTRRIPSDLYGALRRKLDQMQASVDLNDLRVPPGNRLEALRGDRVGQHSIRINDQWRLIFRWLEDGAHDVEMVDYH